MEKNKESGHELVSPERMLIARKKGMGSKRVSVQCHYRYPEPKFMCECQNVR